MANPFPSYQDDIEHIVPIHPNPEESLDEIGIDAITVVLGKALAERYLHDEGAVQLMKRANDVRREIARETGVIVPGIHFRDDRYIGDCEYAIYVRDFFKVKHSVKLDHLLMLGNLKPLAEIDGELVKEPIYGLSGKWMPEALQNEAYDRTLMKFDPLAVIVSHCGQVARDNFGTIFTLDAFSTLRKHIQKRNPVLIEEFARVVPLRTAHRAFRILLEETVWPRDAIAAIEAMLDASDTTSDPALLAEAARKVLVPAMIGRKHKKKLTVYKLDAALERRILDERKHVADFSATELGIQVRKTVAALAKGKYEIFLLCSSACRRALAELTQRGTHRVHVYATDEVPRSLALEQIAFVVSKRQPDRPPVETTKPQSETATVSISHQTNDHDGAAVAPLPTT